MPRGLIRARIEDLARYSGQVLSLYRQLLWNLNSPNFSLKLAALLAKNVEVSAIVMLASEEIPP
ncbi:hypothetical protein RHMOL_Rhmol04G0167800 [Rhododendron molle]|uniref:Uncharacterized protein n=1 Tax=Rhododendron molle TaxID=49168 RepID=A0ACC0P321_RHOML|nr:hypothetical protein RHMOL_Rhmol04G0167800 [Rhododendron molle]